MGRKSQYPSERFGEVTGSRREGEESLGEVRREFRWWRGPI